MEWFEGHLLWLLGGYALAALFVLGVAAVLPGRRAGGRRLRRACFAALPLLATFACIEVVVAALGVRSDGFAQTRAGRRWFALHWTPINSLGFRDLEPSPDQAAGRGVVLVVGDSIVAGHGIDEARDRFPDVLGRILGPSSVVVNAAKCGWGTRQEVEAMRAYPLRPDVVVLSYFPNDIEEAAAENGLRPTLHVPPPPRLLQPFVRASYLADLVYWRAWRAWLRRDFAERYFGHLADCAADPHAWETHEADLVAAVEACRGDGARLAVVVFPELTDLAAGRRHRERVIDLFQRHGVRVVDVARLVIDWPVRRRIVNVVDAHPSREVHARVARELAPLVAAELRATGADPGRSTAPAP
jgi:hypothetical protein